ncbi:MAG TPA: hypothetical protein DD727_09210 [Clostridiales bacterium]|nr:hypothetical protein [Clostridiales bacterium]
MDTQSTVTSRTGVQKIGKQPTENMKMNGPEITPKDMLYDSLTANKQGLITYQTAINETISEDLKNLMLVNRDRIQWAQSAFFNELFNMGEYQAETATPPQVADAYEIFNGYRSQLPYQQQ